MPLKLTNNATALLTGAIDTAATQLAIEAGAGAKFPSLDTEQGDWFPIAVVNASGGYEIMRVTGRDGDVLTVSRAQEGTVATAFDAGARVGLRLTAAALLEFIPAAAALQADNNLSELTDKAAARAELELGTAAQKDVDFFAKPADLPTTGDLKLTLKTAADAGWVMFNDGTIGSATSGASTRANSDCEALFKFLWNGFSNTVAPVVGGRGISADADWTANKKITLLKAMGRAIGVAGAGSGLTARALGDAVGEETHTLTTDEIPAHSHEVTDLGHDHDVILPVAQNSQGGNRDRLLRGPDTGASDLTLANASLTAETGISLQEAGGDEAHNNMQPTVFLNVMVKL
jgi:microcystin-dependent protein